MTSEFVPGTCAGVSGRPQLPDDPEPGEYRCPECGCGVTVGQSGTEYGHGRRASSGKIGETCPRRPVSEVNPTRAQTKDA